MSEVTTEVRGEFVPEATKPPAPATPAAVVEPTPPAPPAAPEKPLVDPLLVSILSTKRAHQSTGDTNFRIWLFNKIKNIKGLKPVVKEEGCVYVTTEPKSTIIFSCHIDTVHGSKESDGSKQALAFDEAFSHLFLADKKASGCLGGDDGCGIYIMLKMLEANVPGHYMFHTGEERGGIGAHAFVKNNAKFLDEIEAVVAFDRPVRDGENPEVIITQGGQNCASTEFGTALANALNAPEFGFEFPFVTSTRGVFTDSKVYAGLVPECVNLGCFYNRQHGPEEYVDTAGLEKLVKAAIKIDWAKLPIVRKPAAYGTYASQKGQRQPYGGYPHGGGAHPFGLWEDPDYGQEYAAAGKPNYQGSHMQSKNTQTKPQPAVAPTFYEFTKDTVEDSEEWLLTDYTDFVENADVDQTVYLLVALRAELTAAQAKIGALKTLCGFPA